MRSLALNQQVQIGDLVQLVSPTNKVYLFRLTAGEQLHTHRGVVHHEALIGLPWGSVVTTHLEAPFYLLQPSLSDLLLEIRRNTQIIYPKDIGYILVAMGIGPGTLVLEAGTGSGALTTALAWSVGAEGHVFSYDIRPEIQNLARKNLERVGLHKRVTFKTRDIAAGFDEAGVDALFYDLPNPYDYITPARQALKSGGYFGAILPTTNQVTRLLSAFHPHGFAFVDVCEILLRFYKANADRLRPVDRMVAHTGYLIFARSLVTMPEKMLSRNEEPAE